jgi:hypothetical protein
VFYGSGISAGCRYQKVYEYLISYVSTVYGVNNRCTQFRETTHFILNWEGLPSDSTRLLCTISLICESHLGHEQRLPEYAELKEIDREHC